MKLPRYIGASLLKVGPESGFIYALGRAIVEERELLQSVGQAAQEEVKSLLPGGYSPDLAYAATICQIVATGNKEQEVIQWMAFYLFVDEFAHQVENELPDGRWWFVRPRTDIFETVPEGFAELELNIRDYIKSCVDAAVEINQRVDLEWNTKYSAAQLLEEFGQGVLCRLALTGVGHGVSLNDDQEVADKFSELDIEVPDMCLDVDTYEAIDAVKEALGIK
jgi:hypothetical protein